MLVQQVFGSGGVPEPHDAVGVAQLVDRRARQPVVRAVVLAALLGRHVVRRTAVQRGHRVDRETADGRRVPVRGPAAAGRRVRVPRARALSAAGRAPRCRAVDAGQQPLVRVVRPTVPAKRRVRGRHAHATAVVRRRRPGTYPLARLG